MARTRADLQYPVVPTQIRQVLLHAGMPRTGSTFIQNACEQNRDSLLAKGVLYPRTGHAREEGPRSYRTAGHNAWWLDGILRGQHEHLDALWREVCSHDTAHTLLLSSEELFFAMGADELGRIAAALHPLNVTVVIYLRRQDQWFESMYAEAVTGGYYKLTASFEDFLDEGMRSSTGVPRPWADADLDYYVWLDRLRTLFGSANVRVRSFDDAPKGTALFADFLDMCDLDASTLSIPGDLRASNAAYGSREDIEIVRFFNAMPFEDNGHYMRFVAEFNRLRQADSPRTRPVFMGHEVREKLLLRYESSNARVAREFAGKDNGRLFAPLAHAIADSSSISARNLHLAYSVYLASRAASG